MSFLFRSMAQSTASSSRRATAPTSTFLRYASTSSPASSVQESIVRPDALDSSRRSTRSTPIPESLVSASDLSRLQPASDPDNWWNARSIAHSPHLVNRAPGNQYTGRSIQIKGGRGFQQAYRQLMGVLSRTGVRNDVRNSEYYEKPHVMRNRQKSERHRRRFQEMIRNKVQMVQAIRNRR